MSVKKFTYEEIIQLRNSPYVLEASPNQVHFSAEFKEKFWTGIQEGRRAEEVVAELGINPEILGKNRLNGLRSIIRQEVKAGKGFRDLNTYKAYHEGCTSPEAKIHYLEQQLAYKDQEIEFLKKIVSLGKERTLNPVTGETAAEPGAVFRYYLKSAGSYNACPADKKGTMTTRADGVAKSKALPLGTYVVEQTAGAEGTDFVADFEVVVSESGKTYTFTKDNPYWTGSVSIVKYEDGTEIPLQATFNLMDSDQNILEAGISGEDGTLDFRSKLVYGQTYYIQEVEAPEGYVLDSTLHPITVEQREQKIVLKLENTPEEGSITAKKVDTKGDPMSGVKFRLGYSTDGKSWSPVTYREEGSPVTVGGCTSQGLTDGTLTTGTDGIAIFTGLRISGQTGKVYYRLIECSTADGSTMLVEPAFEGELPMNDSKDITITAVNSDVFELPHTGSSEMLLLQLTQLLCASCCLSLFLLPEPFPSA